MKGYLTFGCFMSLALLLGHFADGSYHQFPWYEIVLFSIIIAFSWPFWAIICILSLFGHV